MVNINTIAWVILCCVASAQTTSKALINKDYENLRTSITRFILSTGDGPERNCALLVRASFHDVALFNGQTFGPEGCLSAASIQAIPGNAGLSTVVNELAAWIQKEIPGVHYPMGDVFSFGGKIAMELTYPCMNIPWGFGRSECPANPVVGPTNQLPDGNFTLTSQIDPIISRYGLVPTEMAVLLACSHGMAKAMSRANNSGFTDAQFATVSNGQDWIKKTVNEPWRKQTSPGGNTEFVDANRLLRMPIDLLRFPSIARLSGGVADFKSATIEANMRTFITGDRSNFDQACEAVYTKMLNIGVPANSLVAFKETPVIGKCVDNPKFPPVPPAPVVISSTTSSKTAAATSSSTAASSKTNSAPASSATGSVTSSLGSSATNTASNTASATGSNSVSDAASATNAVSSLPATGSATSVDSTGTSLTLASLATSIASSSSSTATPPPIGIDPTLSSSVRKVAFSSTVLVMLLSSLFV